jgi:hypothetical protein
MSMFGNTLFVRLRLVSDMDDGELTATVHAMFAQAAGIHFVRSQEDDGARTFCALLSATRPGLLESLRELLAAAKNRGALDGVRELVIEVGRAADLPQGVAVALYDYASCSSAASCAAGRGTATRLQSCSSGLLMTFSLLTFDPTLMAAPPELCLHRQQGPAALPGADSVSGGALCSLLLMSR